MKLPELLSPAGNAACALAAFDAGADAVYAGLSKFNARERGDNFTEDLLRSTVDYAHKNGKKVYLTLNTLIRECELSELLEMLANVSDINPDGVLVQDLGVLRVAREYFPHLELHGSTQMGIHNSAGMEMAEKLGLSRVVLERQLTLEELSAIRKRTKLELEVFIHGALCCSLSGSCLFSSYLGGWSGNRGKCKQPCRRRYYSKNGNGFFFSPQDLCAAELIPQLCKIGVNSLKIEGRLRQPDYVHNTVKAYRMLLDTPEADFPAALSEARNILSRTCGRRWSTGFYTETSPQELIKPDSLGAAGMRVGNVDFVAERGFSFVTGKRLFLGDRLRIQPHSGDDGTAVTLTRMLVNNQSVRRAMPGEKLFVCCDKAVPIDGIVFKIGESFADYSKRIAALPKRKAAIDLLIAISRNEMAVKTLNYAGFEMRFPLELADAAKHPLNVETVRNAFAESNSETFALGAQTKISIDGDYFLPGSQLKQIRREVWEKLHAEITPELLQNSNNAAEALDRFLADYRKMKCVELPPDTHLTETVAMKPNGAEPADRRAIRANDLFDINKLTQEAILPEFCPESRLTSAAKAIDAAWKQGIRRFRVTSLYALAMLEKYPEAKVIVSAPLPVCNSLAVKELERFNVSRVTAHIEMTEADIKALQQKTRIELECFRLGRPSLLVTRARIPFDGAFNDARGNKFELRYDRRSGLSRIFPVQVVSIPRIMGVYDFYDLRNAHWKNAETDTFNFDKAWN